jgi:hypothetical protein
MAPYRLSTSYKCFGGICCVHLQNRRNVIRSDTPSQQRRLKLLCNLCDLSPGNALLSNLVTPCKRRQQPPYPQPAVFAPIGRRQAKAANMQRQCQEIECNRSSNTRHSVEHGLTKPFTACLCLAEICPFNPSRREIQLNNI